MSGARILFTGDLHGTLTGPMAAKLAALKAENPDTLLFDAGDALKVGNVGVPLFPEPAWKRMAEADYDAMALGNREFHITEAGMRAKLKGAPMPVLCANIHLKGADEPALAPFTLLRLPSGLCVGVLGLLVPMVTERMAARVVSAYLFDNAIDAAARWVPKVREKCELLVALTHIGLRADRELASRVPGIDLIIGGHSHELLEESESVCGEPIVHAGSHGKHVGELVGTREANGWAFTYRVLPLR